MALSHLLWACPRCGTDRGIGADGVCGACGTRFRRGSGAEIRAAGPDGEEIVRPAWEWVDDLPDPGTLLDPGSPDAVRTARGTGRTVTRSDSIFGETGYLNRIERYGDARPVSVALYADRVEAMWTGDAEQTEVFTLESLTAVQASSSTLQLKARSRPLVTFRFENDSVYLWELLLHVALRDFYRRTGRGEIVEFQPRIAVR